LGLDEIGSGGYLLGEAIYSVFKGVSEGISGGSYKEIWFNRHLVSALEFFLISHILHHLDQLNGIEVEYTFRHRMIAKFLVVAGEAQDIIYTQGGYT